jgi:hypothetical protein
MFELTILFLTTRRSDSTAGDTVHQFVRAAATIAASDAVFVFAGFLAELIGISRVFGPTPSARSFIISILRRCAAAT